MDLYVGMCFSVCLVILGLFGYLMSVKLAEQNNKISTMFELVTNLIQDIQVIKIQHTVDKISFERGAEQPSCEKQESPKIEYIDATFSKIVVSDVESLSEDESEDESGEESDDESSTNGTDSDTDNYIRSNLNLGLADLCLIAPLDTIDVIEDDSQPTTPVSEKVRTIIYDESDEVGIQGVSESSIQITLKDDENSTEVHTTSKLIDLSKPDYSKMDVTQLKKLVAEKSSTINPAKLKKKELIAILLSEQ